MLKTYMCHMMLIRHIGDPVSFVVNRNLSLYSMLVYQLRVTTYWFKDLFTN
jgi:hypothetical protein